MLSRLLKIASYLGAGLALAGGLWIAWLWRVTPDPSALRANDPQTTRFLQYYCKEADCALDWVPLSRMSDFVPQAVVLAEDVRFFRHTGLDFISLKSALKQNLRHGRIVWGGSTITQQLAKNLYLGPEKTVGRKLREIILTYKIERSLPKARILEIYLNVAQWGPSLFGVGKASRHYFDKAPGDLGPLEASYLASILPNPEHADEPQWKERFTETGGRLFEILAQTYLPPVHRESGPTICLKLLDPEDIPVNDYIVAKIFGAFANEIVSGQASLLKREDVISLLTPEEAHYVEKIFETARGLGAPTEGSCRTEIPSSPGDLVPLKQPSPLYGSRTFWIPEKAWPDLKEILNAAKEEDVPLVVRSAYRGQGYQIYLWLATLRQNHYCLAETAKTVALPEASEHGCLKTAAIDFGSLGEDVPFEDTEAFRLLERVAASKGFEMSFPKDHPTMAYEPWHWRWKAPQDRRR